MPDVYRYLGVALEDPFNETPAPAAQIHLDILSASLDAPTGTELEFEGSLGRASHTHRAGFYSPAGNVVTAIDVDTVGWFFYMALGGYTFTTATPPAHFTHELYGVNNALLPSGCFRVGKDVFEHVFSGCVISSLTLEVTEGYGQLTAEIAGVVDSKAVLVTLPNLLLPESFPLMFHDATATRDAVDASAEIKTFNITINNNTDAAFGQSIGSRHPRRVVSNAREILIGAELFFDTSAELERMWGGATGPAADGTEEFGMAFLLDAGADGSLEIAAPRVVYNSVAIQPSGRSQITQTVEMKAYNFTHTLADTLAEVDSEILVTVINDTPEMLAAA